MSKDPLSVNARLYKQIARLLDEMESADMNETMTFPQRISALIAIGRIQKIFVDLRKGDLEYGTTGSAVRKYAQAFAKPNAISPRKTGGRSNIVQFDSDGDDDEPA